MASEWPALVDRASVWVYNDLVDEVIHGVVFDVHRSTKLGLYLLLEDGLSNNDQVMSTGTTAGNSDEGEESRGSFGGGNPFTDDGGNDSLPMMVGLDVFGTSTTNQKKTAECLCPNCQRNMAASRFAPHLEKCMGMGRNSSRLASRRIASSATREAAMASDDDNEDDHEWMGSGASERSKKRKKEKHSSSGRRMKVPKKDLTNGPGAPSSTYNALTAPEASEVEAMSLADRRSLLSTMCGVVSGHTGRMCTRSLKCPQHSENQRRGVREVMLPAPPPMDDDSLSNNAGPMDAGMQQQQHHEIDVDTWEEGDSLASLLTQSQAAEEFQGSPAESTSTTSSTSSKKKDNKIKTVRRRSKVDF